ncbi:hypothetical protein Slin14017_G000640 [Septoria linicola]|nr:hypothetical protein Slin14017_G000640 [Septoria linicola]
MHLLRLMLLSGFAAIARAQGNENEQLSGILDTCADSNDCGNGFECCDYGFTSQCVVAGLCTSGGNSGGGNGDACDASTLCGDGLECCGDGSTSQCVAVGWGGDGAQCDLDTPIITSVVLIREGQIQETAASRVEETAVFEYNLGWSIRQSCLRIAREVWIESVNGYHRTGKQALINACENIVAAVLTD